MAELIISCASHLTSLSWLPSIHFRESTMIESRLTADRYSSFLPHPNQHINTRPPPLPPLHIHISKLNPQQKPFAQTIFLLLQLSNRPNILERSPLNITTSKKSHTSEESLAELWRPLDTALSGMSSGELAYGKLKEVEIVLSAIAIWALNQANRHALLRRRPCISSRGTRRRRPLVSLTLSPLMGLFILSKNSSMRL